MHSAFGLGMAFPAGAFAKKRSGFSIQISCDQYSSRATAASSLSSLNRKNDQLRRYRTNLRACGGRSENYEMNFCRPLIGRTSWRYAESRSACAIETYHGGSPLSVRREVGLPFTFCEFNLASDLSPAPSRHVLQQMKERRRQ